MCSSRRRGSPRRASADILSARGEILAYVDADTMPPAGWIEQIEAQFGRNEKLACLSGPYSFYDLPGFRRRVA